MPNKYDFGNKKYSEEEIRNFIKKYPEKCDWNFWVDISADQNLSENFIREFQDKVHWGCISANQNLSENLIREFQDKVYWYWISREQNLSENFIREFQDKVHWGCISCRQDFSEKFLIEFIDKVKIGNDGIYGLKDNKNIPESIKNNIINLKKVRNA